MHARDLNLSPLILGGNVFGWTVDEAMSRRLLDAAFDSGLSSIDTADMYSVWVPGHEGGESEAIIGRWLASQPGRRTEVTLCTKVGAELSVQRRGLSCRWILQGVEDSLRRLNTDYIDLYFSHYPDDSTPHEETLRTYEDLIASGKVRAIGASNFSRQQLQAAEATSRSNGLPAYSALQVQYNLYDRAGHETETAAIAAEHGNVVVTYFSLASGFLTGKYRAPGDLAGSARGEDLEGYFDTRGLKILAALGQVAEETHSTPAEVALAWLRQQPGIAAPIASATNERQLASLVWATQLSLSAPQLTTLDLASRAG
ncbi:aldo/keto reductase [Pseudomonas nicosulfuronedens]|uniref:Aldo/keto reductase n=1 Tax=Pseudomonas nicosulfuronedens TaxID=2571105 RepID=A0A5R9QS29_9PSED|nr:aldo/keto reductase [Pseudomonas nicosulfuronedens]MDH1012720.1 aldo/keto reductase [Pseudomonas nicosulfuronedens]MDH1980048.1 aldo/keto reductase [Pseudomonas nicosulfuronedens]MDH2030378.1 aldo/keto reductase [Pseudomonas nicosulfuronedens]TLX72542.1 aldo/keto reductase [Pseudomonas nicosulfuronedens]